MTLRSVRQQFLRTNKLTGMDLVDVQKVLEVLWTETSILVDTSQF